MMKKLTLIVMALTILGIFAASCSPAPDAAATGGETTGAAEPATTGK